MKSVVMEQYNVADWRRAITAGFLAVTLPVLGGCGTPQSESSRQSVDHPTTITGGTGRMTVDSRAPVEDVPNQLSPVESLISPGKSLGTFTVPRMCDLKINIVAMPHEQVAHFGEDTAVDALPVDPKPNPGCQAASDHAAQIRHTTNPKYAARSERTNPGEYKGTANQFTPTAAWDMGSAPPDSPGIMVVPGHRTTHTAPFSELDMVQVGDAAELSLINGQTFHYEAIYNDELMAQDGSVVIPGAVIFEPGQSYIMTYGCAPQRSSADRQVVVWKKI